MASMASFAVMEPSDITPCIESRRKMSTRECNEDLYETIIKIPIRSPPCSALSYPLTYPMKDSGPFPADDWLEVARRDAIFLQDGVDDMTRVSSAKLTLMRDVFWPWLRTLVTIRQDSTGRMNGPWWERDFLGMLNWHRLLFQIPLKARVALPTEQSDGMWRLMVLSSPWGKCEHFDHLLYMGEEPSPDSTGKRENMVFSMEQLARCRRQAFRGMRHPISAGLEHEAIRRLVEVANCGDFGNNMDPWYVYVKHWGPEPYNGTVEEVVEKRAEWIRRRGVEGEESNQPGCM